MSWIKIKNGLITNKKIARLAGKMKWGKLQTVGFLVSFWIWAIENCEDGQLKDIQDGEIAFAVGLENADGILDALIHAGLVDLDPCRIHDWIEHQHEFLRGKYKEKPEEYRKITEFYRSNTGVTPEYSGLERKKERKIDIKKDTAADAVVDDKKPVNWENCKTDLQRLLAHYISIESPELYKTATRGQANGVFKRYGRAASGLLSVAGGIDIAKRAFDLAAAHFNKKGLSWTLDTITANSAEFVNQALKEKSYGPGK